MTTKPTHLHSHLLLPYAEANAAKAKESASKRTPTVQTFLLTLTDTTSDGEEERTANSGFKKLAVQWLIEHSTSHQHLWWLDSKVLRNRHLRVAANRSW